MKCSKCGYENNENDHYCSKCGNNLMVKDSLFDNPKRLIIYSIIIAVGIISFPFLVVYFPVFYRWVTNLF